MGKRIYIYRSGATSHCALTGAKDEPRLPPAAAPDRWHFWMQIGPLQPEHRGYGFNLWAAVKEITTNGYHLFTGSQTLLRKHPLARSKAVAQEGQTDA
ncbi:MAG: hypothetical protein WAN86_07150 [Hyphomicrobiaceae bacterium]